MAALNSLKWSYLQGLHSKQNRVEKGLKCGLGLYIESRELETPLLDPCKDVESLKSSIEWGSYNNHILKEDAYNSKDMEPFCIPFSLGRVHI